MHSMILYQNRWTCRIQNRTKVPENSQIQVDSIPCQVHLVITEVLMNVSSIFRQANHQPILPIQVAMDNRHKSSVRREPQREYQTIPLVILQELIIHCLLLKNGTLDKTGLVSNRPGPTGRPRTAHRSDQNNCYLGVNPSISKGPHYHPYNNSKSSSSTSKVDAQPKSYGSSSLDALGKCVDSLHPTKVSPSLATAKPKADTTVKTVS